MKRIFTFTIILIMLLSLAACAGTQTAVSDPTAAPTAEASATDAPVKVTPEPTEEPTEAPAEAPTEAPTESPEPVYDGYFRELHADEPFLADLDKDGAVDSVLVSKTVKTSNGFEEYSHTVTITLASRPNKPFAKSFERCYDFSGAVVDFNEEDDRMEVIFCCDEESADYVTYVFRVNEAGSGLDVFEESMMFGEDEYFFNGYPEDYSFDTSVGLPCFRPTEILGTFLVAGTFTADKDGIVNTSDMYEYPEPYGDAGTVTLVRELTVTRLDGNMNEAEEITLPAGTVIIQRYTDLSTWVIIGTEDGALYKASVKISETADEWSILINGINQDELGEIPYAG